MQGLEVHRVMITFLDYYKKLPQNLVAEYIGSREIQFFCLGLIEEIDRLEEIDKIDKIEEVDKIDKIEEI